MGLRNRALKSELICQPESITETQDEKNHQEAYKLMSCQSPDCNAIKVNKLREDNLVRDDTTPNDTVTRPHIAKCCCGQILKTNEVYLYRGAFYCYSCVWSLAENGEFYCG